MIQKKNDYKNTAVVQINKSHSQSVIHSLTDLLKTHWSYFLTFHSNEKKNQNNENHSKFIITNKISFTIIIIDMIIIVVVRLPSPPPNALVIL